MGAVGRHIGLRFAWSDTMNDHDTTENDRDELTRDEVFELFNNPRRRYVLYLLEEEPDGMSIGDLTDEVTAWEEESTVENLTQQQRKRVYVSLYQTHIVKMDELGVVEFDRDSGVVELTPKADRIRRFLPGDGKDRPWALYYLLIAVVGLLIYLSKFWGLLGGVSWAVIAVFVYGAFVLVTVRYYHSIRSSRCEFEDLIAET
jgi:DNA-binding transcriptional ArsR family regulator